MIQKLKNLGGGGVEGGGGDGEMRMTKLTAAAWVAPRARHLTLEWDEQEPISGGHRGCEECLLGVCNGEVQD